MRVLVTGATGFFGTGIVARLREAGHEVVGASRRVVRSPGQEPLDVTSPESCAAAVGRIAPDTVVHAAALAHVSAGEVSEALCRATNVDGTRHVLDAAVHAGVRRLVFISSVAVYGDYDLRRVVRETDSCRPHGLYGAAKILAEEVCRARTDAIEIVFLRMATMYSPDWFGNIRKRVRPLPIRRPVYVILDPESRRYSLCSLQNGAAAVLWAVERRLPADVYNVADQHYYRQADILKAVENADGPGLHLPVPILLPWAIGQGLRVTGPLRGWRAAAYSRYWKYCESNLYSPAKLNACGLATAPDLLALGRGA